MPSEGSAGRFGRFGRVTAVAAFASGRVIGRDGAIPWHLPADFAHFKATTMGGVLVMGRATYDSIGRPLPGRTSLVITRDRSWTAPGAPEVLVAHGVEEALALAEELPGETFVAGGTSIYTAALPYTTHQVLTEVHLILDPVAGDATYPEFDPGEWIETARIAGEDFDRVWWERRTSLEPPTTRDSLSP